MAGLKQGLTRKRFRPTVGTWVAAAIASPFLIISTATSGLGGFLIMLGLITLLTATYTLMSGRRGWVKLPSRKTAAITLAASLVVITAGGAIAGPGTRPQPTEISAQIPIAAPSATPTATPSRTPTVPRVEFTESDPGDPDVVTTAQQGASVVVADTSITQTTALALLATLPVKGKAPKTGYDRTGDFGAAWLDVDRNGCDTRNDILARDLNPETKSGACKVLSGVLADPYTGTTINFVRGQKTSALVQIDHVVALLSAWQTGAQQLTQAQRISLANDPMNLFAVDGRANDQKGAGDTATWLPSNKAFRCTYVSHQVSVKATYGLWVTQPEYDAMARVLSDCSDQQAFTSVFSPAPAPIAPAPPAPAPIAPAPAPAPPTANVVHPGSYCSVAGASGVTTKGTPMVCKTTATDSRLRWRAA